MFTSKKYTCGQVYPSGCVIYTGELPEFIDPEKISCDASINEILEAMGKKVNEILVGIDITSIDEKCFTFNPATVLIKDIEQAQIDKICEHETEIAALQEELVNFDIGNQSIEIDLGCLAAEAEACEEDPDTYSLLSILTTFKNAICDLRTQVDECCAGGGNSGTSGTSGANGTSGSSGSSSNNGTSGSSGTSGTSGTCGV